MDKPPEPIPPRDPASPHDGARLAKGVGPLVLTLLDMVRQLLERQAGRRMEAGNLTADELDRVGRGLMKLEQRLWELKQVFELDKDEELDLRLGQLDGHEVSLVETLDALLDKGVTVSGDLRLSLAGVDLLYVLPRVVVGSPDLLVAPSSET